MTFLPIVARELRVAARRRGTYWWRFLSAFSVIALGTWCLLMIEHDQTPKGMAGLIMFGILTGTAALYCLFSGIMFTADSLSEEKREGTLGLLFLTDLKSYDVVLGKWAASSLNGSYGLLSVLPMLAIPLLMGGVAAGEFWRMSLVALNTLFFSLALGMMVSSLSRSARQAAGMTLLLILLITAGLPAFELVEEMVRHFSGNSRHAALWLLPSPGFSFVMAFDQSYTSHATLFWESLLIIHAIGWVSLIVACVVTPRTWKDKPAGARRLRWRERWQQWSYGNRAERDAFRKRLLERNAFFWLAARARLKPACVWLVLGLGACVWAWGLAKYHHDWLNEGTYATTAAFLNLLLKTWFASEAGRSLAEERNQGALELVLSTPLTVRDILRGQRLALERQFLGPVILTLAVEIIILITTPLDPWSVQQADRFSLWVCLWIGSMLLLLADLIAFYWVGMWHGLNAKGPNRVFISNFAIIMVLPWLGYAIVTVIVGLLSSPQWPDPNWKFFAGLWLGLSLATDICFGAWARQKLLSGFRAAAARRYTPKAGFWKRFWLGTAPGRPAIPHEQ
jgi:ABC-type transport system involved in multi-copper enzyme maturation permease subunit